MYPSLSTQEFVAKWRKVELKECSAAQSDFNDLCRLMRHLMPVEDYLTGQRFTFEAGASKSRGSQGWADVWKKDSCRSPCSVPMQRGRSYAIHEIL